MTLKSSSQIITDADVYIPDNITEDISAGDVRDRIKDIADSFLNCNDGGLILQAETGYSTPITPSSDYAFSTKKYVDDEIAGIVIGVAWGGITGTITDQIDLTTYLSTNYALLDGTNQPFTGEIGTNYVGVGGDVGFNVAEVNDGVYYGTGIWLNQNTGRTSSNWSIRETSTGQIQLQALNYQFYNSTGSLIQSVGNSGGNTLITESGSLIPVLRLTQNAITSVGSNVSIFVATGGAHTQQLASTEVFDVNWNLARTVTKQGGSLTNQRAFVIQAPTYAFAGASTITNAGTLAITGAPTAGTNATITNAYSVWVQGGKSYFQGQIEINASTQNSLVLSNGIKIANNTDSAATAGGGSIKYVSSTLQYSDGSNWLTLATGSSASYSFDEIMASTGITAQYGTANTAMFMRFIPKANITITKLYYYMTSAASDTIRVGIWSDTSGAPSTLLQQGNEATTGATTTGLRSVTVTSQALTAGTTYWLGIKCDSGAANFGYRAGVFNSNIVRSGFNSGAFTSSPSAFSDSIGAYMAIGV